MDHDMCSKNPFATGVTGTATLPTVYAPGSHSTVVNWECFQKNTELFSLTEVLNVQRSAVSIYTPTHKHPVRFSWDHVGL